MGDQKIGFTALQHFGVKPRYVGLLHDDGTRHVAPNGAPIAELIEATAAGIAQVGRGRRRAGRQTSVPQLGGPRHHAIAERQQRPHGDELDAIDLDGGTGRSTDQEGASTGLEGEDQVYSFQAPSLNAPSGSWRVPDGQDTGANASAFSLIFNVGHSASLRRFRVVLRHARGLGATRRISLSWLGQRCESA